MAFTQTSVPAPYIDATGCHVPAFTDILTAFQNDFRSIYGSDVLLEADDQDGELLALLSLAYSDVCSACLQAYNAFSPATAQGVGLSSNVKLNGLLRKQASYSTATVTLIGVALTVITNGMAQDTAGYKWALPSSVQIPTTGQIDVVATCTTIGAIVASAGAINKIATPTRGWQTVSNAAAAAPGLPVELDAQLRQRQAVSTAGPATTPLAGIIGRVAAVAGVTAFKGYENDTDLPDTNGQPGHTICMVVEGGADTDIANAISSKTAGVNTFGSTAVSVLDAYGIPHQINFFRPALVPIVWYVRLKALTGYTSDVGMQIAQALANWTNGLGIGQSVLLNRANVPANLNGAPLSNTYEIVSLQAAMSAGTASTNDILIAFNARATSDPTNVIVNVVLS